MKPNTLFAAITAAMMSFAATSTAQADEQIDNPEHDRLHGEGHTHDELEEIVVTATPLQRDLIEISQSATVLSGEALQRELNNNIGDTLSRMPGMANASFGENVGRPVIRGQQGQRVGVLANNMTVSDASGISQDHAVSVEPFLADQVEVLRGPSTLLYGSGSIGGVVNIVTHAIPQESPEGVEARALFQVDSAADQRFGAGRIDFGGESFAFHANAFYRRTDDYEIPGAAELYPEDDEDHDDHDEDHHEDDHDDHDEHEEEGMDGILENSFLDNEGGALGLAWIGDKWRLGGSFTAYESDYGIPGAHHHHHEEEEHDEDHDEDHHEDEDDHDDHDEHEEEEEELVTIGLESRRGDVELVGSDPFGGFEQLSFRYSFTDYTHTEFEGEEIGTVFDSETSDGRLELRHNPWGNWSGAFGGQYTDVDFSALGEEAFVPPSNTTTGALFWVESADFDAWQLDLGIRYEDVKVENTEDRLKNSFNPFSFSLGAIWHVTEGSHLAFNFSRAERAPTSQELYSFGPHLASQTFEIGNRFLETETNYHLEGAYRVHAGRLTGSLVLYTDNFKDFIYQQNTGEEEDELPVRLWSQQDADFVGGELELRYDLGRGAAGHWQLFGFIDSVRGKLQNNQDVPLMPPTRIGLGADWDLDNWVANVTWIRADDHTRTADYETPTPGYDLLNAEVSWRLPFSQRSDWVLFLKGRNLLDEDIRNSTSYLKDQAPQIGRNFVLGLRFQH